MRRIADLLIASAVLLISLPLIGAVSAAIVLDSGWPVLFRQTRMGRFGEPFTVWKFRTMRRGQAGMPITIGGDPRITSIGRILRRTKLDELPQLVQVLLGRMTLVGPRPEIPSFVDLSKGEWSEVLAVRPGLFDPATLQWINEERRLAGCPDPLKFYREQILPQKLALSNAYLTHRTAWTDAKLVAATMRRLLRNGFGRL